MNVSFSRVAATVFAVLALAHAYRVMQPFPIQLGSTSVPQWVSLVAVVVTSSLSIWGFRSRG